MDKMMIDKISSLMKIEKYLPSQESEEYAHYQQRFQLPISLGGRWLHFNANIGLRGLLCASRAPDGAHSPTDQPTIGGSNTDSSWRS
jgi:hypothetical protein